MGVLYSLIYKFYSNEAPRIYLFDLMGASIGCLFGTFSLSCFQLSSALILLAFFSFSMVSLLAWRNNEGRLRKLLSVFYLLACMVILLFNVKTDFFEIKMNSIFLLRSKGVDFKESCHQWNAYSRASLFIDSAANTDRHSMYAFSIVNGEGFVYPYIPEDPYYLKLFSSYQPTTLGFLLKEPQDILILMVGAGKDMIEAYSYSQGRSDITGVELNPMVANMAQDVEGYHLKDFFAKKNVHLIVQEGRSYVESTNKKFDSIILSFSGALPLNTFIQKKLSRVILNI